MTKKKKLIIVLIIIIVIITYTIPIDRIEAAIMFLFISMIIVGIGYIIRK